ncbi:hypothetical protein ILYODFUR_011342 [Ilyodon furcidens]|uniref:Uncharacterized protein n=1 Tax=Ilyodon furcidens TaxID=33524 RepID=A0ABV0VGA1_9TELE
MTKYDILWSKTDLEYLKCKRLKSLNPEKRNIHFSIFLHRQPTLTIMFSNCRRRCFFSSPTQVCLNGVNTEQSLSSREKIHEALTKTRANRSEHMLIFIYKCTIYNQTPRIKTCFIGDSHATFKTVASTGRHEFAS